MLNDRILWSNDMLGGGEGFEYRDMSLFYCNGILSRIYFNCNNPLIMLEFKSNQQGKIADVENPLQKAVETIGRSKTIDLSDVYFVSNSHQRYENGVPVRGLQTNCKRAVKIENNIDGEEGYTVTIFNLDNNHPAMSSKPMKVIQQSEDKIVLRGFGYDNQRLAMIKMFGRHIITRSWDGSQIANIKNASIDDASFVHYGLTVHLRYGKIIKCTLHMHDRNVNIEYYTVIVEQEPEIVSLSKQTIAPNIKTKSKWCEK
jgi:hypothetical protein